jgi:hypothetical protein
MDENQGERSEDGDSDASTTTGAKDGYGGAKGNDSDSNTVACTLQRHYEWGTF